MTSSIRAGSAFVELYAKDSKLVKGLANARKRVEAFGRGVKDVGRKVSMLGGAAVAPFAGSVALFSNFDDAMRAVGAISGATGEEFESLRKKAKWLGATTSFTAAQVASLMTELARAGFDPGQIEDMTGAVMDLAAATGTDATLSSGIMSATIRQFGLEAKDASRVADGLTAAANKSFNSVESLGEAMKYAGPVAASANMSLEETLAILGSLGNLGIQGSEAGSSLRRLLILSSSESEKFQKVFGIATKDAQGNARNLVDVLGEVTEATANMGSADRAAAMNEVFGMLAITSAGAVGKSATDTRELLKEIQAAGGIASDTAKEMNAGIGGAFRILTSSIEGVAIEVGESLAPEITAIAEKFSSALTMVTTWIRENREVVVMAAKVAAAILAGGAALVALGVAISGAAAVMGALGTVFGVIVSAVGMLGTVLAAMLSPIGLVVAGVVGLGGYLVYASGAGSDALTWLGARFESLKKDAVAAFGGIGNALAAGDLALAGKILWLTLKMEWQKGINFLTGIWSRFSTTFLQVGTAAWYGLVSVANNVIAGLEVAWVESVAFLGNAWTNFTGWITKGWNSAVGFLSKTWTRFKAMFDDSIDVEAEVARVDRETDEANTARDRETAATNKQREDQRKYRRQQIEQDRSGAENEITKAATESIMARERAYQDDIDASQAALGSARKEWQDALDEAAKKRAAVEAEAPERLKEYKVPEAATVEQGLGMALKSAEDRTTKVAGTFSAASVSSLASSGPQDRIAKATEETAKGVQRLVREAGHGGLVFG